MEKIINKEKFTNFLDTYFSQVIDGIQNKTERYIISAICLISTLAVVIALVAIPCIIIIWTISYWAIPVAFLTIGIAASENTAIKHKLSALLSSTNIKA